MLRQTLRSAWRVTYVRQSPVYVKAAIRPVASAALPVLSEPSKWVKIVNRKLFIDGKFVDSVSGKTFPVLDPRTEEVIAQVAEADANDVNKAVAAARKAFDEGPWPKMTAAERGKIIYRIGQLIEQHADELAALESLDNGKPLYMARAADVPLSHNHFYYFAGWADKIHGKTIPCDGPYMAYTHHEPLGVVGQIIPWNFPLLMFAWKVAPALACGNTIVLKTAEQTPLSALKVAELSVEAGLPPGVLNVLSGFGPTAGAPLASHKDIDKIAFTGSTEVGRLVGQAAAKNIKPCTLELGGKSPVIVCEDADVDEAVEISHFALFFNHGQCCAAGSRIYVHEKIYEEFVEKSAKRAKNRKVGDPFQDGIEQGPQVDQDQLDKIMSYIDLGKRQGARLVAGGSRIGDKGYFVEPTVFADVKDDMKIAREEIFGPVQSIMKFKTLDEVIKRANDSNYGLASGIISKNIDNINTLSRALRAGTVWVNCHNVYDSAVPFGGYGESGVGREKGEYALHNYMRVKAVYVPIKDPAWR